MPLYVRDYTEKRNDNITGHGTKQINDMYFASITVTERSNF